ncbi:hypothetical protein F511_30043 [Dorcoceras hygrometricum]|uniref:Uncharacterized protein n=1 Tax=Dorcoceras hygrometricum TaxID=472368 RepID=A0A2Z7CRJ4_9LAMI|nr:hypothetical protein F511_30043 [Dorcoceras hygrometricum]
MYRKVLVAEESTKSWADTDSEYSSSSSSSSDSEQEEVHCFMADQTSDDEVFDFSNVEFTREDLVSALNDMVKEYRKLSHSFEEVKAENISLKSSSIESSSDELEDIDSLKIELSKLTTENDLLRNESTKASRKPFVPNQPWRSSTKVKGWTKNQPRRDLNGQKMKSKLNRSHKYAQTLTDSSTGKTVRVIQAWVPKGIIQSGPKNYSSFKSTVMASVFITNSYQVNFESVLMIPDHDGMLDVQSTGGQWSTRTEEQGMASEAIVKRKSKSNKKSVSTDDTPVEVIAEIAGSKKRRATGGDAPIIPKKRRTEVVPLQTVEPTPAAAAVVSPAPKRRYPKRKLILPTGSDDETLDEQESVKESAEVIDKETTVAPSDEVDVIIEQVLAETSKLGTDETEKEEQRIDVTDIGDDFSQWLEESFKDFASQENEPVVGTTSEVGKELRTEERVTVEQRLDIVDEVGTVTKAVGRKQSAEELMSTDDLLLQISDDMMLPSITAAELTKIRRGESITINEVQE